jgi:hypothetical protein
MPHGKDLGRKERPLAESFEVLVVASIPDRILRQFLLGRHWQFLPFLTDSECDKNQQGDGDD